MRAWFLLASLSLLVPCVGTARCLSYEPTAVVLVGELASRTLPGPPNYTSIARGDVPEVVLFLRLAEPVCVAGDPASSLNSKSHAGILEVQLSIPLAKAKGLVGKRIRASGALFGARTGHHRTPVLLRVSALRGA